MAPRPGNARPPLEELARLDREGFAARFPRSAVRRAKREGLLRNVLIALGNGRPPGGAALLEELAAREEIVRDPVLRETLEWARRRAGGAEPPR